MFKLIKILFFPISFIPRKIELMIAKIIGFFLYKVFKLRTKIVRQNLLTAYGNDLSENELKKIEKDNYFHYGCLLMEILHLPFDAEKFAKKHVRVHNLHILEEALKKGKGVFMLSGHIGYWEIMSVAGMLYKFPMNVITKYLRINLFNQIWIKSRERYGIKLIEECFTAKYVLKAIKKGEIVAFVLDQFMGPPVGVKVNFFNKPAWTIASLSWFVQKTGAVVLPVVNYRDKNGDFDLTIYDDIGFETIGTDDENIVYNTQRYSNVVENFIKEKPEQWLWLHRRWKKTREDDVWDAL